MDKCCDVTTDGTDTTFKALAHEIRRDLLDYLRERQGQTVADLAGRLNINRPAVRHHLSVLEAAKLVSTSARGKKKYYLDPGPVRQLRDHWLEKFI